MEHSARNLVPLFKFTRAVPERGFVYEANVPRLPRTINSITNIGGHAPPPEEHILQGMASTSNSSLARSRSLRGGAASTLKPIITSTPQTPAAPTNITLFLTNLRLLDLDLRDDWPDITALTFSTKDSQQNQKKRIQCVEWALYQLFALWDPEETRNVPSESPKPCIMFMLTLVSAETPAVFPTSRTSTISQSPRSPFPMSRPSKEEWSPR